MSVPIEVIELELEPIPPDTIASVKRELMPLLETTLREADRVELLSEKHIQIQIERAFPVDEAVIVGLTFLSGIALETFKEVILPVLKKKFIVKQKSKQKKK